MGLGPFHSRFAGVLGNVMQGDGFLIAPIGDRGKNGKRVSAEVARLRISRGVMGLIHAAGERFERGSRLVCAVPNSLVAILDEFLGGPVGRRIAELFLAFDSELVVVCVGPKRSDEPTEISWTDLGGDR
jgi:hypothetical protein